MVQKTIGSFVCEDILPLVFSSNVTERALYINFIIPSWNSQEVFPAASMYARVSFQILQNIDNPGIWRYFGIYEVTEVCLHWTGGEIYKVSAVFEI